MDSFYDCEAASIWLDRYITSCVQGPRGDEYLGTIRLDNVKVTIHQEPRCFRMTNQASDGLLEVELRVPGIICSKTLPPQLRPLTSSSDHHVRNLRQFVKLTGLRSPMFHDLKLNVDSVFQKFGQGVAPARLLPFQANLWDGEYALDAHMRYFTDRRQASSLKHEPLPTDVDPMQYLDVVRGSRFIHAAENRVEYCKREDTNGNIRYIGVGPESFQVGDIVEVSVTFVAYPSGKDEYVLKVNMKALCMVNSQFREDSNKRRLEHLERVGPSMASSKGKRGRAEEDQEAKGPMLLRRRALVDYSDMEESMNAV